MNSQEDFEKSFDGSAFKAGKIAFESTAQHAKLNKGNFGPYPKNPFKESLMPCQRLEWQWGWEEGLVEFFSN